MKYKIQEEIKAREGETKTKDERRKGWKGKEEEEMSSGDENNVEKMRSNCGMSLSSNNYNNYNDGDQVQRVSSSELSQLNHHQQQPFCRQQPFETMLNREQITSSHSAAIQQTISTTTNRDPKGMMMTTTAPRQYTETPDIFKELPKMSSSLNNYQNSCSVRQMENDGTNNLTGNVQLAIDHSLIIDSSKEVMQSDGHPPHPPPLPLLPSSSSISSSTNSDNTLTCGSFCLSDNNYPILEHHLPFHPLSCGQQQHEERHQQNQQTMNGILVRNDGSDCHHYQYHDVDFMTNNGQRLSQLTSNPYNHCTMGKRGERGGRCLSSSSSTTRGGNFSRSYSSSSQLSSSDYGSTATGSMQCPNLNIYSPLSVYTQNIESKCLENNYIESKFTEHCAQLTPVETIFSPGQYHLTPSDQGSHYSINRHSVYGDTIYPGHELRNQFSDQNTIIDSYATIQRLKDPTIIPSPSMILSPRVILKSDQGESWNQMGNTTSSDTIQQQYLKHKNNIEKQCAKDSEKIKAKMSQKSSTSCGQSKREMRRKRRDRRKCFQNESPSSFSFSWIVHLLASCPFICFLVRGKRHKVLATSSSLPRIEEIGRSNDRGVERDGEDSCSLTVLDKSGRKVLFGREMTGKEDENNHDEEGEECFDSSLNCNFSPSKVKCLERMRRKGKKEIEDVKTMERDFDAKQPDESDNFLPNVSFNLTSSSSDDQSLNDGYHIENNISCKSSSSRSSFRTFYRLFLFLLLSIFTILIFNYFMPISTIYGFLSSIHSSHGGIHYGDVNGLNNPSKRWWKEGIFYEIFPASFKDTNSDGFGDLNGIREKLSYLKSDLGVTGIRLNSIFKSLDYPFQYDHVVDFKSIDPHIGTFEDFVQLVRSAHDLSMAIILDINPVMTSDQHPWATQWLLNKSLPSLSGDFSSFYTPNPKNVSTKSFLLSKYFIPSDLCMKYYTNLHIDLLR